MGDDFKSDHLQFVEDLIIERRFNKSMRSGVVPVFRAVCGEFWVESWQRGVKTE
jgi:hypothetical protein